MTHCLQAVVGAHCMLANDAAATIWMQALSARGAIILLYRVLS